MNIKGNISNTKSTSHIGGVVGYNKGNVINCSMSGTVTNTGANGQSGGLVGQNAGSIINCYCLGAVNSTCKAGGISGTVEYKSGAKICNCYSAATISGALKGGIVGGTNSCTIKSCFYQEGTAKYGSGNNKNDDDIYAFPESQMKGAMKEKRPTTEWESGGSSLVQYLSNYLMNNKVNVELLSDWEISSVTGYPTFVNTYESTTAYLDENDKRCAYRTNLDATDEQQYTYPLVIGGIVAGNFTVTKVYTGYVVRDTGGYIALASDGTSVIRQDSVFVWKYDGGLYAEVKASGIKSVFLSFAKTNKLYLTYGTEGFGVTSSCTKVQAEILMPNHTIAYRDNKDGRTHTSYCSKCEKILSTDLAHDYDYNNQCRMCKAYKNPHVCSVSVPWGSGRVSIFSDKRKYGYPINIQSTGVAVKKVEYSLDDMKTWTEGTYFNTYYEVKSIYIFVTDANGEQTLWFYDGSTTKRMNYTLDENGKPDPNTVSLYVWN